VNKKNLFISRAVICPSLSTSNRLNASFKFCSVRMELKFEQAVTNSENSITPF
jgi:hypothetical protein